MSPTQSQGNRTKILVVDDHRCCRETTGRLLAAAGYEVLAAADPVQAEVILARHADLGAIVADVCLDPAGDLAFARRLAVERPNLPVLFVSGYSREVCQGLDLLGPGRRFLEKPFSLAQLETALGALLSAAAPRVAAPVTAQVRRDPAW